MTTFNVVRRRSNALDPKRKFLFDYWLALSVAGLVVVGLLMVFSTTFDLGMLAKDDSAYYIKRQLVALGLGLFFIVVLMQFDYHALTRLSIPLMLLTVGSLLFILFFGEAIFGAARGLAGGSYQPSELAKLVMILYIAHWIYSKGDRIKMLNYGLVPFGFMTGVMCALILLQPNLSVAILVALISCTVFFIAGADLKQFALVILVGGVAFGAAMVILPHAAQRVNDYTVALRDPNQASWQVQQALIALARGGWFGVGLGESIQKFGALPAAHTDGPFAILGEELGLFGTLMIIGLFSVIAWRGFRIATKARDMYGFLLAVGITVWITYQALINVSVITAVIPFTGMPLPFLSYGGSSLMITLIGIGILLNISRDAAISRRDKRPVASE